MILGVPVQFWVPLGLACLVGFAAMIRTQMIAKSKPSESLVREIIDKETEEFVPRPELNVQFKSIDDKFDLVLDQNKQQFDKLNDINETMAALNATIKKNGGR